MAAKPKKRHALASRAALAGVSSALFVSGFAALAIQDPASQLGSTTITEPPTTSTTVVIEHIARTIYVDTAGNVIAAPPGLDPGAAGLASSADPNTTVSSGSSGGVSGGLATPSLSLIHI